MSSQEVLLQDVAEIRRRYYENLVRNDLSQKVYLRGWINRVEDCLAADI
ncbi:putative peptidoglycan-binding domain-containing protein [Burkholderia sp. 22PA0099]